MFKLLVKQRPTQRNQASYRPAFAQPKQCLAASGILMLQRTVGNQAVQRILQDQERNAHSGHLLQMSLAFGYDFSRVPVLSQPKSSRENLMVNEPRDRHEQETDWVAEQVMRVGTPNQTDELDTASRTIDSSHSSASHTSSGGKAIDPKTQHFFESRFGHNFANVRVHADRPANESARTLQASAYAMGNQRACACGGTPGPTSECAACHKKSEAAILQSAASHGAVGATAPPIVHEVLRSPGQPLDVVTRAFMEPRFGHDFTQVRVHTDARAAASAQAVNALAYTVGNHVVFGAGQYAPGSDEGRRLLAHELTHVMQQHSAPRLIQRQAAPGAATAMSTEAADIDSQIVLVQQAIEQLREREAEDESGEMAAHIRNLMTALSELRRVKASGTSEEQMRIANHFAALSQETLGATGPAPLLQRWAIGMGASADPLEQEAHAFADYITQDVLHQHQPATAPRPVAAACPRIQRQGGPAEATITLGVAAGPPGWVALAIVAVGVAVIGGVYLATRPRTYERAEERAEPRVEPRVVPRTCATVYPAALNCESLPGPFTYSSPQAALQALKLSTEKSNLRLVSPAPSTGGPCPGVGMHYGVKDGGVYIASISCCPCCRDTPAGPIMTTLCRII
jgi:Domain of unknown function (DUF4157)